MSIELARTAGYCTGVKKAVDMAMEAPPGAYVTLGPIIHNRAVEKELEARGTPSVPTLEDVPAGRGVIIRSHGVTRAVYEELEARGIPFLDATCPFVRHIHEIARQQSEEGRTVLIVGDPDHPEVQGILGWCERGCVVRDASELDALLEKQPELRTAPLSVVCQTTNLRSIYEDCIEKLKKECTNLKSFDTICGATRMRQEEAARIASESDLMVVVGDRHSSNTRKLLEICRAVCPEVLFVENAAELAGEKPGPGARIGITAGASTPGWIIKEVYDNMSDEIIKSAADEEVQEQVQEAVEAAETVKAETAAAVEETTEAAEETVAAAAEETVKEAQEAAEARQETEGQEEDFATLLEGAIKTLNTGDKITGIVTAITPTEVQVDLGTKHAGVIPIDQLSSDPTLKAEDVCKVGDEIECFVVRVNDMEGVATLSKKRLDAEKNWEIVEAACEEKTTVEGRITEENKGGIVANVKGIRVFIPASQTGIPRGEELTPLVGTTQQMRITEVNRARRRVVGSIRAVATEARRAAAEKIWSEIEEGKEYKGTVKSLTSYGAFVDIGGIDGMIHVSELSWKRIRTPADVLKVGDEVDVYVISFDPEKKKISLGYKNKGENPWTVFTNKCKVGDVIDVKVVKLMTFGAFAEILPGVDGLIHISQIADRRINKPDDVLTEGETVTVKITDIDYEKQKVSLSIRALLNDRGPVEEFADEPEAPAEEPAPDAE